MNNLWVCVLDCPYSHQVVHSIFRMSPSCSSYPLTNITHVPHSSVTGDYHSSLCFSEFSLFRFYVSEVIWCLSFSCLMISLNIMPSDSSILSQMAGFPFLWLNNIPLCKCIHTYAPHFPYLFIWWWTLRLFPCLGYCK